MATETKSGATVRISDRSRTLLREMSVQYGEPMQSVLDKALEHYRRAKFFDECDAAYAAMQQDPEEWARYQQELVLLEGTLMDGLDPNEVWPDDDTLKDGSRDNTN